MIEIKQVSFAYDPQIPVIQEFSLQLDTRSTAIIGENGSGKTTLVKLLKGLLKPDAGEIFIQGKNTRHLTAAALAPMIGLVFQNPNDQIFKGRVLDEVMFGPRSVGQKRSAAKKNAEKALQEVGLLEKQNENPQDLNESEKKLVCIASVLAMDPSIVIFDEPTIAQDALGKKKIQQIIQNLKQQGKLVLSILHDMDFVAENFERTIVMHQGKVRLDDETKHVFSQPSILNEAHVDRPYITQLGDVLSFQEPVLTVKQFLDTYQKPS